LWWWAAAGQLFSHVAIVEQVLRLARLPHLIPASAHHTGTMHVRRAIVVGSGTVNQISEQMQQHMQQQTQELNLAGKEREGRLVAAAVAAVKAEFDAKLAAERQQMTSMVESLARKLVQAVREQVGGRQPG
jgi:hypothetical protein